MIEYYGMERSTQMPSVTHIGRVLVPVNDQDAAIEFYRDKLGFSVTADIPYGEGSRWVEVMPPDGGAAIALTPPHDRNLVAIIRCPVRPRRSSGQGRGRRRSAHGRRRDGAATVLLP